MPTVFSHPAAVAGLAVALGGRVIPFRLFLFGVFCTVLPDMDVISFKLGIKYADVLGHRGFSHSLLFAFISGLVGVGLAPLLRCSRHIAFYVGVFAVAGHILLDAMTNGGLGVAAFWPFDQTRYFCDWRPIQVSPLSPRIFLSRRGLNVLLSELRWVWLPCAALGLSVRLYRTLRAHPKARRELPQVSRTRNEV